MGGNYSNLGERGFRLHLNGGSGDREKLKKIFPRSSESRIKRNRHEYIARGGKGLRGLWVSFCVFDLGEF